MKIKREDSGAVSILRLSGTLMGGPDADEFIAFAVDGAARMQQLINDLLEYSRVQTEGYEIQPCDSEKALATALKNLQRSIEETGAQIEYNTLPRVLADELQLARVFQNVIANAIKYRGDSPPQVTVRAERHEKEWRFAVGDHGIGMSQDHFERIFVIFQRLHTREEYSGTGIGLAICKRIIERHGGRIWVDSRLGEGSTFYFTLPTSD